MIRTLATIAAICLTSYQPTPPKTFTIELTPDEVQVVYDALGELPAKKVEVIRLKIVQQVNKQNEQSKTDKK
jgi:hypothetical protein